MENQKTLEILKMSILMEKRGQAFYTQVARQTTSAEVKKIFEMMAKEEVLHEEFLVKQIKEFQKEGHLGTISLPKAEEESIVNFVLSDKVKKDISAAGFEAAAISAAIDMENNAIKIYGNRAAEATDPNEKALFAWLSEWEKSHHQILIDLDNDLKESVWHDNQFWPF
jgi:rubrerythrin